MKPIKEYGVIRVWGGFEMIGITAERGRQVYGRRLDESSTHVAARDVIARLPDRDSALSVMEKVGRVRAKFRPKINEAQRAVQTLERVRDEEINDIIRKAV
jgi:hypothetical protein